MNENDYDPLYDLTLLIAGIVLSYQVILKIISG